MFAEVPGQEPGLSFGAGPAGGGARAGSEAASALGGRVTRGNRDSEPEDPGLRHPRVRNEKDG